MRRISQDQKLKKNFENFFSTQKSVFDLELEFGAKIKKSKNFAPDKSVWAVCSENFSAVGVLVI